MGHLKIYTSDIRTISVKLYRMTQVQVAYFTFRMRNGKAREHKDFSASFRDGYTNPKERVLVCIDLRGEQRDVVMSILGVDGVRSRHHTSLVLRVSEKYASRPVSRRHSNAIE